MDLISAALLGVVQGLTEFLPVSSSGHLILARAFFGWDPGRFGIAFDVACHVGTLLAVVAFFRADVARLIVAAPGALSGRDGEDERLGRLIIAGTIPIVIVGGLFGDVIEARLRTPLMVAINLVDRRHRPDVGRAHRPQDAGRAIARLRRGAGDRRGAGGGAGAGAVAVGRDADGEHVAGLAARLGGAVRVPDEPAGGLCGRGEGNRSISRRSGMAGVPVTLMAVGLVVSAIVGYFTVKYFLRYLASHSLAVFAYYRFALAAVTVVWLWTR